MIDLSSTQLQIIHEIIKRFAPNAKACVFGSRLGSQHHPYSDLDVAIQSEGPLSLVQLSELEEAFSESDLPFKVDLVDMERVSDEFRSIINNQSVPLN